LGCGVWGLEMGFGVWGFGSEYSGERLSAKLMIQGLGLRVQDLGFRVQGSGFRIS